MVIVISIHLQEEVVLACRVMAFDNFRKMYAYNNHHLMAIIHDKLMPLGLSRSESSISYNAVIDRALPIDGMKVADSVLEEDEEEE